mgnify:CR=1 FL=1
MAYSPSTSGQGRALPLRNMQNVSTIVLSALLVAVVGVYLVGSRLEARFAGGQGQIEACGAEAINPPGASIKRGELMSSSTDAFAQFQLCDGTMLYLDSNTQMKLAQYRNPKAQTETQLELIQGRVIVDGLADVRTRNTVVAVGGAGCEFVHYSWLDELDVTPLATDACKIKNTQVIPPVSQTSRYNTFVSTLVSTNNFNPSASAAKNFYTWTGLQFETLR